MFIFTKEILNGKVHFFVHWFAQVNNQKTTVKKKITYFLLLNSHFLKNIAKFFTARSLDVRFWDLLYFICLKFNPQYSYLLLLRKKMCWFSSYFWQGKVRNIWCIFTKSQRLCLHKILTLVRPRKLIAVNFTFL